MGSNPVQAWIFFRLLNFNCLSETVYNEKRLPLFQTCLLLHLRLLVIAKCGKGSKEIDKITACVKQICLLGVTCKV